MTDARRPDGKRADPGREQPCSILLRYRWEIRLSDAKCTKHDPRSTKSVA
jgi:hypothetical protein